MKRILIVSALAIAISGCGEKHIEFAEPPPERLTCPDEPAIPANPVTDEKNAAYLKSLRSAWAGCRSDVDWLRNWFRELK